MVAGARNAPTATTAAPLEFRDRLHAVCRQPLVGAIDDATRRLLHQAIKKVSTDLDAMAFNTAISALMVFVNHLARLSAMPREAVRALVLLVSPFAPHVAEELWQHLGHAASLAYEPWPAWDKTLAVDDVIELPVQVNGKVRGWDRGPPGRAGGPEVRLRAGPGRESRGRLRTLGWGLHGDRPTWVRGENPVRFGHSPRARAARGPRTYRSVF